MQHDICVDNENICMPNKNLPPILLLQMDNYSSNNKNHFVFAFLSLLIARRVFDIVEVGFLLVGHTHEDIDGTYEILLAKILCKDSFTLKYYEYV